MKPIKNISAVKEAGDSSFLKAGGYICKYTKVTDVPEKEYLQMEYDIAEGEFTDYYKSLEEKLNFWGGRCYRSYKEKALPMFKRMCSAVTKSNPGFIFDGDENADETTLVGKKVGLVLGEEEYIGNDGSVKTRLYVVREVEISNIIDGKFKVPPLKKLEVTTNNSDDFMKIPDGDSEESPFN